jgi:hypothetical protein
MQSLATGLNDKGVRVLVLALSKIFTSPQCPVAVAVATSQLASHHLPGVTEDENPQENEYLVPTS